MKKLLFYLLLLSIVIFSSCGNSKEDVEYFKKENKDIESMLGGNHELRKFNVKTTSSTSTSGFYFLVVGGYSSTTSENTVVRCYFLNYKNEYQLMETRLTNVNIKIDSTCTKPYVRFYWSNDAGYYYNTDKDKIYDAVTRMVIYCKDSDFQPDVNINNLK
jgi:hypothetical protein